MREPVNTTCGYDCQAHHPHRGKGALQEDLGDVQALADARQPRHGTAGTAGGVWYIQRGPQPFTLSKRGKTNQNKLEERCKKGWLQTENAECGKYGGGV